MGSQKVKHTYDSGIYQRKIKAYVYTKTCRRMFMVALLIRAQNWKHCKFHQQVTR